MLCVNEVYRSLIVQLSSVLAKQNYLVHILWPQICHPIDSLQPQRARCAQNMLAIEALTRFMTTTVLISSFFMF